MKPFWVTFYSYKGGVGRSMALANLATLLARRSRRVFMIDFDLEAPGLDSFRDFGLKSFHPGVVEYAHEFQKTRIAPDIEPYVQECHFEKPLPGKLWLMSSGRKDDAYNAKRVGLNWEQFYENGVGELFIENWKASIFRKYKPDYVFVDSRTGLTDVGGICTLHLPDLVVLLFGLNDQNLNGIAAVLQTIRSSTAGKPPQVLPVATPVPNLPRDEDGLFKERLEKAEKLLGLKVDCHISYNPQASLVERIFALERIEKELGKSEDPAEIKTILRMSRIVTEYHRVLREIEQRNQDGLDSLISKTETALEADDESALERIKKVFLDDYSDRADAIYHVGQIERRVRGRDEAVLFWRKAIELDPGHAGAFKVLAAYYRQKKLYDDVVGLHAIRIEHAKCSNPEGMVELYREEAEDLMSLGRFAEASACYNKGLEDLPKDPHARLAALFNAAEASRRASREHASDKWQSIVEIFEREMSVENMPVNLQANILQAMHIPHACLGSAVKAKEFLERAERCALATGKTETIFCVKTYTFVPVEEFLEVNKIMAEALSRGQLWDGIEIPLAV